MLGVVIQGKSNANAPIKGERGILPLAMKRVLGTLPFVEAILCASSWSE